MTPLIGKPGVPAPGAGPSQPSDPEAARRGRVALAWSAVAGYGGSLADPRLRNAVRVARAYAEGCAAAAELAAALTELTQASEEADARAAAAVWTLADAWRVAAAGEEHRAAVTVADALGRAFDPAGCLRRPDAARWETAWLTSGVVALARGIARTDRLDLLPILADALQDAGCDDPLALDHCRDPGPHAPECWVLAAILGPGGRG